MSYRDSRGNVRREYVSAECLADSAGDLARCPVTLEHPEEEVTASNVDTLGVGDVDGEVAVERGGFVRVKLAVRRQDALDAIRAGKAELSPGYTVLIDPTPGEHPVYGRYDCQQIRRKYNHLAVVSTARGGPEVRLRTDSAAVATAPFSQDLGAVPSSATPNGGGQPSRGAPVNNRLIPILTLLGITRQPRDDDDALELVEASVRARKDSDATAAEKARQDAEKVRTDAATLQAKCDDLQRKLDEAMAENVELKKKGEEEEEKKDRASLEPLAKALKVDAAQHPKTAELRKAIATAHLGGKLRADASDAYIAAVVDLAKESLSRADGSGRQAGREAWANQRTDSAPLQPQPGQGGQSGNQPQGFAAKSRNRWDSAFAEAHGNGRTP